MSTSKSWDVNRHTARYTGPVSVVSQCKNWCLDEGFRKRRSAPPWAVRLGKDFTYLYIQRISVDCVRYYLSVPNRTPNLTVVPSPMRNRYSAGNDVKTDRRTPTDAAVNDTHLAGTRTSLCEQAPTGNTLDCACAVTIQ